MHKDFQYSFLSQVFSKVLSPISSGALLTDDFDALYIKYQHLADIGTLSFAAKNSHQYLNLHDGDMSIVNDPQSGSLDFSSVTLTLSIEGRLKNKKKYHFFICSRVGLKPSIQLQISNSQLRIPPTPLAQNWSLNEDLFKGISEHPTCPIDFFPRLRPEIQKLFKIGKCFKELIRSLELDLTKRTISNYYKKTQSLFLDQLNSEFPYADLEHTFTIDPDVNVRVQLEHNEDGFLFNFTGTESSELFSLSDSMTLGACKGALLSFLNTPPALNSGLLSCVQIITPKNSLVKANNNASMFWAKADGASLIANLISQLLWALKTNALPQNFACHGVSQCSIDIGFKTNDHFYDTLESGSAATPLGNGSNALNIWKKSNLKPSVEKIESRFPLHIKSISFRTKSKGTGKFDGGSGSTKVYEVLKEAKFKWLISQSKHHPHGGSGGKHAIGSEITLIKATSKEKEKLPFYGEIDLEPHDVVMVHAPGGGGFGEEATEEES